LIVGSRFALAFLVVIPEGDLLLSLRLLGLASPTGKNKVQKSGVFLAPAQTPFSHHVYHAFHHVFTIKKPRSTTHFFQNPPSKTLQKGKKAPDLSGAIFF
jgi:hypothetical protein